MTQTGRDFDRIRDREDNRALDKMLGEIPQQPDPDEDEQRNIWDMIESGDLAALVKGFP